ncbi:flagellar M-ring protein FliF [Novosphingobium sp. FSY-8]|uniref:Flagellar M-ring protein n=1 Tax=Novosphingobium ovatum TaxID=1908523 RepID=A0ABW9XG43_9SPHN|nr:flagellar basal-body MS-ring/collar protein FliF [Novosphingobium ovatum]NBC37509.1 flagellar M-ring protein FliF [Novosphingobium ovatum]
MAELVPAGAAAEPARGSLLAPLTDPAGGPAMARAGAFLSQPPVKKALPWFAGVAILGAGALAWNSLSPAPQRVLYGRLDDGERASVVDALDKAKIGYTIDTATGALTVDEANVYRARMVVAQTGSLTMPDTASDSLNQLPIGASRALEDERLRAARERELMLSIKEIEGVQSVRVHIAEGQKSVFVREQIAPSASVMVRLVDGRQLSQGQVQAIVNLVAGSVPGLSPDAVKVVDHRGRLLSQGGAAQGDDRLEIQGRLEEKLQGQVSALLSPMLGEANFTSEVQVELDMDQITSARETYDKQGVLRSEQQAQSSQPQAGAPAGVPGVTSNIPPAAATPVPAAPAAPGAAPTPGATPGPTVPTATESSATRNFELGREVAVSNRSPGRIKRLTVAVALSKSAMAQAKQADIDQIKQLVSSAVGADPARGDQVTVVVRAFDAPPAEKIPFYEAPWFGQALHYGALLLGTLMVLLLGVRPVVKAIKGDPPKPAAATAATTEAETEGAPAPALIEGEGDAAAPDATPQAEPPRPIDAELLGQHVSRAQQIVMQKPDNAVIALREMLQPPAADPAASS